MSVVPLTEALFLATVPISFGRSWEVWVFERGTYDSGTGTGITTAIYDSEAATGELIQPLATDSAGRPRGAGGTLGWVEGASYDLVYSNPEKPNQAPVVVPWEAAKGGGGASAAASLGSIFHGSDADIERGTDLLHYIWVGSVEPNNMDLEADLFIDTNGLSAEDIEGLGDAAGLDLGTTAGTVAAGDDSRITGAEQKSEKGEANGYAGLEAAGKVPVSQLPSAIMEYQGTWDASTNSPKLEDGKGGPGDVYRVSVAGERNFGSGAISFSVGDYAVYNGSTWEKSDTTDAVASVAGKKGVVTLAQADIEGLIAALEGKQPLDSDLTSIAALTTTAFGRSLLTQANAAAVRATLEAQASLGYTAENEANKDTDTSLAANSNTKYPSQKAVKAYVDGLLAASDAVIYKGAIDCSANPNYPSADAGHLYRVSVAGKIGGSSGTNVEVGDTLLCNTDGAAEGTQAAVGSKWNVIQANVDGGAVGPASATSGNLASYEGTTGKVIKDSGLSLDTDGTLAANSDSRIASQKAVKTYARPAGAIVWYETKVFTIPDEIKVPSGDTDFIPPFIVALRTGQTAKVVKAIHKINGGTSATMKLQKNGSDLTGFTGIEVKTEKKTTDPEDQSIADGDVLALVVTAVSGPPKNLTFAVVIEHTVA